MRDEKAYVRRLPQDFPNLQFRIAREDGQWLVMEIVNPDGGENIWVSNDDALVMGVSGAHCHHYEYETLEEAYQETRREIADYVEGKTMAYDIACGDRWVTSGFRDAEDSFDASTLESLLDAFFRKDEWFIDSVRREGCRIETHFWQAEKDRVILANPDGSVVER